MKKHGMSKTREYKSWSEAKQRCGNSNNDKHKWYGLRGIKMCDEWLNDFMAFYNHIGEKPIGYELDRIDNNKGYEPGNVRWVSRLENVRNRSISRDIDGVPVSEYAKKHGITYAAAWARKTLRPHLISGNPKKCGGLNRKLTDEQVSEIFNSKLKTKELQQIYGVSRSLVQGIRRGELIPKEMKKNAAESKVL